MTHTDRVTSTISWVAVAGLTALALAAPVGTRPANSGIYGGPAPAYSNENIVFGLYASMSGTTTTFGSSTRNGVLLAVEAANRAGGVLGRKIKITVRDDGGRPEQAASVVSQLIYQDKVLAVLGEVASSRSLAAAPVCQMAEVPMISPASTNPQITQVGDYIFRACFIDPFQGTMGARFAIRNLEAKKAAVLTDVRNDYSVGLSEFFIHEFKRCGGQTVRQENYSEADTDFRPQLRRIKESEPDIIYVPGYYVEAAAIARQARRLGMKQPLLGGDGWDSPVFIEQGGSAVQNSYFTTHFAPDNPQPRVRVFVAAFRKRFGAAPDGLAALGYDATRIMINAIGRAGSTNRSAIRDAIAKTKDFSGVTGRITIDKDRNAFKPMVVVRVQGRKVVYHSTIER